MIKKKHHVTPSILSADFSQLGEEVKRLEDAGADGIHVDVMDGHFVPNLTIGIPIVRSLRKKTSLPLDLHLMISKPEKMIESFAKSGADSITFHVEATSNPEKVINQIRQHKKEAGLAIKPGTTEEVLVPLLDKVDRVLIMTVEPGFSGQKLLKDQLQKIFVLRQKIHQKKLSVLIQVDGGVNNKVLADLALADILVSGKFIFQHTDYRKAISTLQRGGVI